MKKVIIMVGLPGSGKSTYIKTILREHPYAEIFSADDYMIDTIGNYHFDPNRLGACHSACLYEFTNKITFEDRNDNLFNSDYDSVHDSVLIVDNTNLTNIERAPYISLALAFEYEVEVITVQAKGLTMADLAKRNVHGVSEETLQRMVDKQDAELWAPWKYNPRVKTQTINSNPAPHTANDGWGNK